MSERCLTSSLSLPSVWDEAFTTFLKLPSVDGTNRCFTGNAVEGSCQELLNGPSELDLCSSGLSLLFIDQTFGCPVQICYFGEAIWIAFSGANGCDGARGAVGQTLA